MSAEECVLGACEAAPPPYLNPRNTLVKEKRDSQTSRAHLCVIWPLWLPDIRTFKQLDICSQAFLTMVFKITATEVSNGITDKSRI